MKIRPWTVGVLFWVSMICLIGGCAKDPQVQVTPFVLKPAVAPAAAAPPADSLTMGTRPYEEAIANGGSARR